nr:NADH dehydrogenase subunit 3 [Sitophilus zeamais]QJA14879.1 NADH dehydrogenase subunit 3 [Sitophilus zeamais]QKE47557.1 NADH dehydrogenase subunit 3 [Sitophilus zeamais]
MKLIMTNSLMIMFILTIMVLILNLISKKTTIDREKSSPFECGFDPKTSSRLPFSLHFFLITIIFLIFDVELTILLPLIVSMKTSNLIMLSMFSCFFILILIFGLIHEWQEGALKWVN